MSSSLWPHGLQHVRPLCPSLSPAVCSSSCPLSQWCLPTILSSVIPFSCLQYFPASGSFPKSQLFISGGQLALQFQLQSFQWIFRWFLLGLTGLISKSPGDSQVSSPAPQFKSISSSLWSNSHPYKTTGKTIVLTIWTFVGKVMSLLFNILSRFVIAFLPREKHLLISRL